MVSAFTWSDVTAGLSIVLAVVALTSGVGTLLFSIAVMRRSKRLIEENARLHQLLAEASRQIAEEAPHAVKIHIPHSTPN